MRRGIGCAKEFMILGGAVASRPLDDVARGRTIDTLDMERGSLDVNACTALLYLED